MLDDPKHLLGALMQHEGDLFWIFDRNGRVAWVNTAVERTLLAETGDLVGKEMSNLLVDDPAFRRRVVRPLMRGEPPRTSTVEVRTADGSTVELVFSATLVRDASGEPDGLALVARDRQSLNRHLSAAVSDRVKPLFLASVSHELRSPLNGILGMAELLLESDLDADQRKKLGHIRGAGSNLLRLVNDLLSFSRLEAGQVELEVGVIDLHEMIKNVIALHRTPAKIKGLGLRSQVGDAVPRSLHGDGARVQQVIGNLVGNAIKFTQKGGVYVSLDAQVDDGRATLTLRVADTGVGIPSDQLKRVFDPFEQVDHSMSRNQTGAGLGLAISRQLVRAMGGDLSVASVEGEGSTFTVQLALPLASTSAADTAARNIEEGVAPLHLNGARILVVDDDELNREVAEGQLRRYGCVVHVAANGAEALTVAAHEDLDLIFMDLQMPVLDGYEVTRQIRAAQGLRRVPIVALTAHAFDEDHARCIAVGMDGYLCKPASRSEIEQTLKRFLEPVEMSARVVAFAEPSDAEAPDLDTARLATLAETLPVGQAAEAFWRTLPGLLGRLREGAAQHEMSLLRSAAHQLKGRCRTMGAARVAQLAGRLEERAKEGMTAQAAQVDVAAIEEALDALRSALQRFTG
jgi:PAS domain S-box-containing protein